MHLLLIHNNYGTYSGEEAVVDRQIALFQELGHTVSVYRKTTEGVRGSLRGNLSGFVQGFYSPSSVRDIKRIIRTDRPDVVIVHNLYPYISPAVLKPIKQAGIPIVMTIHNYRLICPTGLFMRDSQPCELCLNKGNEWSCIKYNCEHSRMKSVGYAGRNWLARVTKAYKENVTIYACITRFQIEKLTKTGYPASAMRHIPNFIDSLPATVSSAANDYVAISGRLSKEKGIDLILAVAKETPDIHYRFAGTIRPEDAGMIAGAPANCEFLGHLSQEQLAEFYQQARCLLIASRCYEGFPMTVLEAASYVKPAIGPAHGGFPEIIDDHRTGLLFKPGDASDLKSKIKYLWDSPELTADLGRNALHKLTKQYTADVVKKQWVDLLTELRS